VTLFEKEHHPCRHFARSATPKEAAMARARTTAAAKARRHPSRAQQRSKSKPAQTKSKTAARTAPTPARRALHRFTVSHHREGDFKAGLRSYAKYRDLGMSAATGGMVQAHVIRFIPPFKREEISKRHYHDVEFQMVYVLKGWYESEFEGQGTIRMHAGSCWIQPTRIKHTTLGYSDDCEVLEIVMPADFTTVMLE
jgi:Cupin domain